MCLRRPLVTQGLKPSLTCKRHVTRLGPEWSLAQTVKRSMNPQGAGPELLSLRMKLDTSSPSQGRAHDSRHLFLQPPCEVESWLRSPAQLLEWVRRSWNLAVPVPAPAFQLLRCHVALGVFGYLLLIEVCQGKKQVPGGQTAAKEGRVAGCWAGYNETPRWWQEDASSFLQIHRQALNSEGILCLLPNAPNWQERGFICHFPSFHTWNQGVHKEQISVSKEPGNLDPKYHSCLCLY